MEQLMAVEQLQAVEQLATQQFDTSSVDVAANLYPHASDPANFAALYTGLKYPATSELYLKERLGK